MTKKRKIIIIVFLIGIFTFLQSFLIEIKLAKYDIFDQINVLFHSDPSIKYSAFVHGKAKPSWSIAHPNLSNYFYVPIKLASKIIVFFIDGNKEKEIIIRRSLALLVSPTFSAANAIAITILFYLLNFNLFQICLLTTMSVCSFSQVIFGSIPECFVINGFFITMCYLASTNLIQSNRINWTIWITLGVFGIGLTITNIVALMIIFFVSCYYITADIKFCFKKAILLIVIASTITFCFSTLGHLKRGTKLLSSRNEQEIKNYTKNFLVRDVVRKGLSFPVAVVSTLTPGLVKIIEDPEMKNYGEDDRGKYYHRFEIDYNYINKFYSLVILITLVMTLVGTICLLRNNTIYKPIAISSLLILLYNWIFHAFWGSEYFVYSQHWICSLIILISGIFLIRKSYLITMTSIFLSFLTCLIFNNYYTLHSMLQFFDSYLSY